MAKRGQSKYMAHLRERAVRPLPRSSNGVGHIVTGYKSDTLLQHEANEAKAKTNAQKGKRGGDCNRTQCQRPNAWWYNKTMQAFYCGDCAGAINESCLTRDHIESFPNKIYVNPPAIIKSEWVNLSNQWHVEIKTADGEIDAETYQTEEDADKAFRKFCRSADLRTDGSAPFHYSELPAKMRALKERIDAMNGHSVSPDEHSVGRDSK